MMRVIFTILICCYSLNNFGQVSIDIDSVISLCLSSNNRIHYLTYEIQKKELLLKDSKQQMLPDFSLNAHVQKMDSKLMEVYEGAVFGNEVTYQTNIVLNQPIYMGGQLKNNIDLQNIDLQISKTQSNHEKQNLILQLQIRFYSQLFHQEKGLLLKKKLEGIEQKLQSASNKLLEGVIRENDLSKVKIEKIRSTKDIVDNNVISSKNMLVLKRIIGCPNNDTLILKGKLDFDLQSKKIDSLILLEINSPKLNQSVLNIEKSKNLLKSEKLKRLPSLSFFGSYSFQNPSFIPDSYDLLYGYTFGLRFHMNLMESIKKSHKVEELQVNVRQSQTMKNYLQMQLRTDKKIQILDYYNAIDNIGYYKQILDDAQSNLNSLQNQFDAGTSTIHDVIEQECLIFDIRIEILLAMLQYNIAKAVLISNHNTKYN